MQPSQPDPAYADQTPAYAPPPAYAPHAPPQQYGPPPQYPVWQGYPNPVAPMGYPYAPPPPSPSVGTTIGAGVLAILTGLYQAFQAFVYAMIIAVASPIATAGLGNSDFIFTFLISLTVASAGAAVLLVVGAILLLMRKLWARWLIVIGSVLTLLASVIPTVMVQIWLGDVYSDIGADLHSIYAGMDSYLVVSTVLSIAIPLLIVVLSFLPPTTRYCTAKR
jgi:hypothetical protein